MAHPSEIAEYGMGSAYTVKTWKALTGVSGQVLAYPSRLTSVGLTGLKIDEFSKNHLVER